jgi:3-phenylpropionate/cinnamic acid dioxygenase small subunit
MSDLEARIRLLEDRAALEDLLAEYRNLADELRFDEWAMTMFTEDAVFDIPGTLYGLQNGRDEIRANSVANNTGSWESSMHLMINPEFKIDGDTATGIVDMLFYAVPKGAHATNYVFDGARYDMEYRRTPDGWRISRISAGFLLGGLAERAAFLTAWANREVPV